MLFAGYKPQGLVLSAVLLTLLPLSACRDKQARTEVAELRAKLLSAEARLLRLEDTPGWSSGCLKRSDEAVQSARLLEILDHLAKGFDRPDSRRGSTAKLSSGPFQCVNELLLSNHPALRPRLEAFTQSRVAAVATKPAATEAQNPFATEQVAWGTARLRRLNLSWDRRWKERREHGQGCWDEDKQAWQEDAREHPERSELSCQMWCKFDRCVWKKRQDGGLLYANLARPAGSKEAVKPVLMRETEKMGIELGKPLTCLVDGVRMQMHAPKLVLQCRSFSPRPFELHLPTEAGDAAGPLANVNLGDLVQIRDYARIAIALEADYWEVSEIPLQGLSLLEVNSCCPAVDELLGEATKQPAKGTPVP